VKLLERAERWQAMLDSREARSRAEIGRREGLSGARVGQVLKLLDLPAPVRDAVRVLLPGTPPRLVTERLLRVSVERALARLAHAKIVLR
jgi:ParB-like chromosome segregation protein Spo0J